MKTISDPVKELKAFHSRLSGSLDTLEKALERFKTGGRTGDMRVALDAFFLLEKRGLALHIKDEEEAVFPVLRRRRYPGREVNRVLNDHKDLYAAIETLGLLGEMEEKGKPEIETRVSALIEMLRDHMMREESIIYRIVREELGGKDIREIAEKMEGFRR